MNPPGAEHDEEILGRLLAALPSAPDAWVEAAASLPATRRDADRIVELAEEDLAFKATALRDLEEALQQAGYEPSPALLAAVRARLES